MSSDVMTRAEAVAYLALDRHGLRDPLEALRWLCRTGRLRCTRIGRHVCFRRAWLDEFLERGDVRFGEVLPRAERPGAKGPGWLGGPPNDRPPSDPFNGGLS